MTVEIALDTPLAHALNNAIKPKLVEVGWTTSGGDETQLSEYIILMLVNGKTQDQIAAEISGDLLNLGPDDPVAQDFSRWLFDQVDSLNAQLNGGETGAVDMNGDSNGTQDAEMGDSSEVPGANIPTGPKSMRNGAGNRSGNPRDKRFLGQAMKAMDRSNEGLLHRRTQGANNRINAHRAPPTGPRGQIQVRGAGRTMNGRPHNGNSGSQFSQTNAMQTMTPQQQMEMMALFEQQTRLMAQFMNPNQQQSKMDGGFLNPAMSSKPSGSLFDRTQPNPNRQHHNSRNSNNQAKAQQPCSSSMDVDMTSQDDGEKREPDPNTPCKFQLQCTKENCIFAHQSPAAKPGMTIDVTDVCSYGAACTNYKCTGRHPSPALRQAYVKPNASETMCIWDANCTKPNCPYKHSTMPACRNGADCAVPDCKYTHNQTVCKFNPCTNSNCIFKHPPGHKRGKFIDKVWTSDSQKEHVSERLAKFGEDNGPEELIVPGAQVGGSQSSGGTAEVVL